MQQTRARQILQSLIQGIDPVTREELPRETVLQHADVLRALLAGLSALEQAAARAHTVVVDYGWNSRSRRYAPPRVLAWEIFDVPSASGIARWPGARQMPQLSIDGSAPTPGDPQSFGRIARQSWFGLRWFRRIPTELLKCSNLIGDRIANTGAQTVGDLWILLGGLLSQREFRCDRHAVDGTHAGYEGKLPEPLSV